MDEEDETIDDPTPSIKIESLGGNTPMSPRAIEQKKAEAESLKTGLVAFSLEGIPLWIKLELWIGLMVRKCLGMNAATLYLQEL